MAQIELFKRGSSCNAVTVKHAEDSYELLRHLMWSQSGRILDGLSPMHPLIKTMLQEADSRETVDLYTLFRLPKLCPDKPDMCLVRQKSYDGFDPETDKYVATRLGKIVREIFVSKSHDEITERLERHAAMTREHEIRFTQSDEELLELMLWMSNNHDDDSKIVPRSCMTNPNYVGAITCKGVHPYQAYAHALGWSLAYVPIDPEDYNKGILSRAVVNHKTMRFVRTFAHTKEYQVDERMNHMLRAAGYTQVDKWDGHEMRKIEHDSLPEHSIMFPYLDGDGGRAIDMGVAYNGMNLLYVTNSHDVYRKATLFYYVQNSCGYSLLQNRCHNCDGFSGANNVSNVLLADGSEITLCHYCLHDRYRLLSETHYGKNVYAKVRESVIVFNAMMTGKHVVLTSDVVRVSRYNVAMHRKDTVYEPTTAEYIPVTEAVQGDIGWEYQSLAEKRTEDKPVVQTPLYNTYESALEQLRADMQRLFGDE